MTSTQTPDFEILPARRSYFVRKLKLIETKSDGKVPNRIITSSGDIATMLNEIHAVEGNNIVEHFYVIYLNIANRPLGYSVVSTGGITGTVADPRIILAGALCSGAVNIVLCHNHPSGSLKPSRADEELTAKIKQAAKLCDINVLDHVIISEMDYYSFADEGLI